MMTKKFLPLIFALIILIPIVAAENNLSDQNQTPEGTLTATHTTSTVNGTNSTPLLMGNLTGVGNQSEKNQTGIIKVPVTPSARVNPDGENKTGSQTPAPEYKMSIGSIYPADWKEPEPRTFTYSGCGSF